VAKGLASIYILRGSCGRYYIGSTENLDRRLAEHQQAKYIRLTGLANRWSL